MFRRLLGLKRVMVNIHPLSSKTMETAMADVPVEVKKAPPAPTNVPDVWQSFRSEMDRLFDRFGSGFGFSSLRRVFDAEPATRSSFGISARRRST